ncbi:MAG: alpha/beta hydrolase [Acidobacteriaceae bacterium]|nr:alpha/beta hydrolase [Acidobacteriaceae bacterium]
MLATPQHVMVSTIEGLTDPSIWKIDPIDKPVLVVNSRFYHPHIDEDFLRGIFPDLSFQNWDGVGHFLMMESPARFNECFVEFVNRHH